MKKEMIMNDLKSNQKRIADAGLKVTQQRLAILELIRTLEHPCTENVYESLQKNSLDVSLGTVYNTLESFADRGLISRMVTETGLVRYEPNCDGHYHLYSREENRIEDYKNEELQQYLADYFKRNKIPGFSIDEIQVQITGRFESE